MEPVSEIHDREEPSVQFRMIVVPLVQNTGGDYLISRCQMIEVSFRVNGGFREEGSKKANG